MKLIKEESEVLGLLMIDDDLFTCDTPLRMIFNEINRLSRMDDDLFTYEGKIHELSCSPSVEQQVNDLYNGNLDVYERKACYDECEKIYAEAVIFIDKRLVRLINVTVEQWLNLKYGDHTIVHEECIMDLLDKRYDEEVITDDELSNPGDGNLSDEVEIAKIFRIETKYSNLKHLYSFRFKNGHAKWPTCNWKKEKYCNGGYLLGVIRIKDKIYFESYEWTYYSPSDEWEDFEHTNHIGSNANSNYNPYLDVSRIFNDHARTNNDYKTPKNEERFDKHGLMGDEDDDIGDLEDYLIQQGPRTMLTKKKKDPRKEDAI
ncbi:hypothetical protein Tco_0573361 [Tanacetum coccineum]